MVDSSIVYEVTYLIYRSNLDPEGFSSILYTLVYRVTLIYSGTYSNIVYGFNLDYKAFSSILYTLVYDSLSRNLVRVSPLGHII